jgi:hypothetical protein
LPVRRYRSAFAFSLLDAVAPMSGDELEARDGSTPGSDAAKADLLGEVLKLPWRGPTPPLRVTLG